MTFQITNRKSIWNSFFFQKKNILKEIERNNPSDPVLCFFKTENVSQMERLLKVSFRMVYTYFSLTHTILSHVCILSIGIHKFFFLSITRRLNDCRRLFKRYILLFEWPFNCMWMNERWILFDWGNVWCLLGWWG